MSGLIILPILFVYIGFAVGMYKLTTSKIVLIAILIFPVWDLIIQKGIKTYYEIFESEPTIYAMPEFDKDGKVESLGLGDIVYSSIDNFETIEKFNDTIKSEEEIFYHKIKNFVELTAYIDNPKQGIKPIRVYLSEKPLKRYEFIDKQKARYVVKPSKPISYFGGLYKKRIYQLIDSKDNNKVIAESYAIHFSKKYNFFRRNVLFWQTGTGGDMIYVSDINNINKMFEEEFKDRIWLNINKGWEDE